MENRISNRKKNLFSIILIMLGVSLAGCSSNNNPVDSNTGTAKVSGRITTTNGLPKSMAKTGSVESTQGSVQGAAVVLAQVQVDGSLKTVSTQTVQTDAQGKFVVETNMSGAKNLIVVADQGATEWKARVSSTVQSGTTVYAPPLSAQSTTEANLYIKVVGEGHSKDIDESDLKILMDAEAASSMSADANAQAQFISALEAKTQATTQASGNSYFGFSNSQMQSMMNANADAEAKLDEGLYSSGDTEDEADNEVNNYEGTVLSTYANANVNASAYAELMRIGLTAFVNATTSMNAQAKFAAAKCYNKRFAFVLSYAMKQQFQAAGASDAQVSTVASAGSTLYASIKNSTDMNQMADAYVQYRSTIQTQLKITLSAFASLIDSISATINAAGGTKAALSVVASSNVSFDSIINAYVTFFNSIKASAQASLAGASSSQVNAASQILILINMN